MRRTFPGLVALALTLSLGLAAPSPARAEALTTTASRDHGAWTVATMENTDTGRAFCAAETRSVFDQILRVALYADDAFLEIRDPTWAFVNSDPLRFTLITGGHTRIVTGQGWAGAMSLDLIDSGRRAALFDRLAKGGATLDIRLPNRSRIAQFPLDGAQAALAAVTECEAALVAGTPYTP